MDQDDTKGQDKRNWRERLGIGAQGNAAAPMTNGAQGSRDLPKISNDFRKDPPSSAGRPVPPRVAPRPVAAATTVRPAPMAPRANAKVINPAPASPDKLAERLRSQRDASTRLAEQRVQVAKQRAETPPMPMPAPQQPRPQAVVPGAPKPKFTFAEEGEAKAAPAPVPQRPAMPPPVVPQNQQSVPPQLSPARPPLGGGAPPVVPAFQPRPQQQPPAFQPQAPLGYPPAGQMPPGFPQGYGQQPVPPYRPIDPASGYAPPPGYVPQQRGFGVPPQQGGYMPPTGPRLNVPPRAAPGLNTNFPPQQDFGAQQANMPGSGYAPNLRNSRPPLRGPVPAAPADDQYDDEYFEDAPPPQAPRVAARPTSTDYQQAYREAEYGYEEDAPRSKAPWILAICLLLALLTAGLGVLGYQKFVKPMITGQAVTQDVPAVAAPEIPAKVQAEQPATVPTAGGASPTKKQIYDRIVGDQEILGGEVLTPAETPAAIPEPAPAAPAAQQPAGSGGEDAAPLPIPPPPGGTGGQQGSIDPASEKQSAELNIPAAGESQAAVVASTPVLPVPIAADPPAPGETAVVPSSSTGSSESEPIAADSEAITDAPAARPAALVKKVEKKKPTPEKVASFKLGSRPVVLVAPARKPKTVSPKKLDDASIASNSDDTGGGLFGDEPVSGTAPQAAQPPLVESVKKKRTLADLFKKSPDEPTQDTPVNVASVEPQAPLIQKQPASKPLQPPVQTASLGGGDFVVQLASFRSRQEATTEFARLKGRNNGALGRFSPIITEANVGGSTRFRLSVGRMASEAQANAVCTSLFAGGERDCLVKRR